MVGWWGGGALDLSLDKPSPEPEPAAASFAALNSARPVSKGSWGSGTAALTLSRCFSSARFTPSGSAPGTSGRSGSSGRGGKSGNGSASMGLGWSALYTFIKARSHRPSNSIAGDGDGDGDGDQDGDGDGDGDQDGGRG